MSDGKGSGEELLMSGDRVDDTRNCCTFYGCTVNPRKQRTYHQCKMKSNNSVLFLAYVKNKAKENKSKVVCLSFSLRSQYGICKTIQCVHSPEKRLKQQYIKFLKMG